MLLGNWILTLLCLVLLNIDRDEICLRFLTVGRLSLDNMILPLFEELKSLNIWPCVESVLSKTITSSEGSRYFAVMGCRPVQIKTLGFEEN